jgi:serine/threonine protein kinase/Flp pilus assembly protein TadD
MCHGLPHGATAGAEAADGGEGQNPATGWIARELETMARARSRGECISAEAILARYPEVCAEDAIRLVYEEACLLRDAGEKVATTELVRRFPQWQEELEILMACDRLLRSRSEAATYPELGEQLGPFRLLEELGRGASGRTYLALEPALASRLVVLKVIADDQEEHLWLARLQHTHIVPLYGEHTFLERGLRALCMPYLGGASLARLLDKLRDVPPGERTGRRLLWALDALVENRWVLPETDMLYRRYIESAGYVDAVCWIGMCLAKALEHAHQHGLVHMDVKPSNVLLAGDGRPMLLDFHLARKPIERNECVVGPLGGTPDWMAPEHRAALDAAQLGHPIPAPVDGRADLYALGLLLREALVGPLAARGAQAGAGWRSRNIRISVGLADIVAKCLAEKPEDRYACAADLADDLRRHLNDLPLRGARNRSVVESWWKWRRRRPAALSRACAWLTVVLATLIVAGVGLVYARQQVQEIEASLSDATTMSRSGRYLEAVQTLNRARAQARSIPGLDRLRRALNEELAHARRGQKALELHALADLIRFRYSASAPKDEEARSLMRSIERVWQERAVLLPAGSAGLEPVLEEGIRADLAEMIVLWAELRTSVHAADRADRARQDALLLIEEARALCGPSPALARCRKSLGDERRAATKALDPAPAAATVLDHIDSGRAYLRAGRFREANAEFRSVLKQRPAEFWSHFYQGVCAYRLGQFSDALAAFRTCIALKPTSAECYYNRALAAEALGREEDAFGDYSRALELDARLAAAALNRGILSYKRGRHAAAKGDFQRALSCRLDGETSAVAYHNLALAHSAIGDRSEALRCADLALAYGHEPARLLLRRLEHAP